ncbi:hypothetical protein [Streptacidiphilus melanogenes]|uniref:hypothetical protein n=1 Tax=Streptacidiphilus melanogenes TaxID=411235 RepID=UPI0005A7AEC6|nr:hypothetical protein [Streptacidiphilus melanogenes]
MPTRQRHRALLASAITLVAALAPWTTTAAQASPTSPTISLSVPTAIDLDGAPGDITVHVTNPTSSDAYVRLLFPTGDAGLTITDSAGNRLPVAVPPGGGAPVVDIGREDSNGNGIPGAPLSAGDITVHVDVAYPGGSVMVQGEILDGATGNAVALTGRGVQDIRALAPELDSTLSAANEHVVHLIQGAATENVVSFDVPVPMLAPPTQYRTSLTFSAQQLAASGNTAQRVVTNLHAACAVDQQPEQPCTWTVNADGSLTLTYPLAQLLSPAVGTPHLPLALGLTPNLLAPQRHPDRHPLPSGHL